MEKKAEKWCPAGLRCVVETHPTRRATAKQLHKTTFRHVTNAACTVGNQCKSLRNLVHLRSCYHEQLNKQASSFAGSNLLGSNKVSSAVMWCILRYLDIPSLVCMANTSTSCFDALLHDELWRLCVNNEITVTPNTAQLIDANALNWRVLVCAYAALVARVSRHLLHRLPVPRVLRDIWWEITVAHAGDYKCAQQETNMGWDFNGGCCWDELNINFWSLDHSAIFASFQPDITPGVVRQRLAILGYGNPENEPYVFAYLVHTDNKGIKSLSTEIVVWEVRRTFNWNNPTNFRSSLTEWMARSTDGEQWLLARGHGDGANKPAAAGAAAAKSTNAITNQTGGTQAVPRAIPSWTAGSGGNGAKPNSASAKPKPKPQAKSGSKTGKRK